MRFLKVHPLISVLAFLLVSGTLLKMVLPTQKQWTDVSWIATSTDDHVYNIATGSQAGELVFVGIAARRIDSNDNNGVESIVTGEGTRGENWHWLMRPGGTKTKLPAERQIFEYIDGRWRESEHCVTLDQWNQFIDSDPHEITIDALFAWLDQTRRN